MATSYDGCQCVTGAEFTLSWPWTAALCCAASISTGGPRDDVSARRHRHPDPVAPRRALPSRSAAGEVGPDRSAGLWLPQSLDRCPMEGVSRGPPPAGVRGRAERRLRASVGQWPGGSAAGLAAELVNMKVDMLVTATGDAALAAKKATGSIPIVFATSPDPVELGLVASLARPGGNITG